MTDTAIETGYAPLNGLQISYEIHGSGGAPLVLLHGAFGSIGQWGEMLDSLAARRKVIAVDMDPVWSAYCSAGW